MRNTRSGNIYKFEMEFNQGWAFAELLDYSDISEFDGRMIQVFNITDTNKNQNLMTVDEIINSGVLFGPAPLNKYPNVKGRNAWILYGRNERCSTKTVITKHLRGLLAKDNWSELKPWFKQFPFQSEQAPIECNYEEVRNLETMILNHPDTVRTKITMMKLIEKHEKINKYYDLKDIGNRNLFVQIVNTYYSKEQAKKLLEQL